jgi:hypothetical protein
MNRAQRRHMREGGRNIVSSCRHDLGLLCEAGSLDVVSLSAGEFALLATIENLCDVSEQQDGELDELRKRGKAFE